MTATLLTILCAVITIAGSLGVARGTMSTSVKGSLAIIALVAVIGFGYSLFQVVLALIATTGERRWFAREISERRGGDRARKTQ